MMLVKMIKGQTFKKTKGATITFQRDRWYNVADDIAKQWIEAEIATLGDEGEEAPKAAPKKSPKKPKGDD